MVHLLHFLKPLMIWKQLSGVLLSICIAHIVSLYTSVMD